MKQFDEKYRLLPDETVEPWRFLVGTPHSRCFTREMAKRDMLRAWLFWRFICINVQRAVSITRLFVGFMMSYGVTIQEL